MGLNLVLKRAGLNINADMSSVSGNTTDSAADTNASSYINSDYETLRMLMSNGNNNNNDPMTSMLPYMLSSNENGKNVDPQVIQSVMMNSMMNSLNGMNVTDNK